MNKPFINPIPGNRAWPDDVAEVPYWVYSDPAVFELEQERIFRGPTWNFVALEAELPKPFDWKATFVGQTPVVVARDGAGELHVWVNRCAHRGALVCRELRGNSQTHTCVYHQWAYDASGALIGVPFRRGIGGKGGYPADFKLPEHGLQQLRVTRYKGLVFASFSDATPPLETYFGPDMLHWVDRVMVGPVEFLGTSRQYIHSNWKLYTENTKDPYHASLLHLFHATFGLYRASQICGTEMGGYEGMHNCIHSRAGSDEGRIEGYKKEGGRSYQENYSLADPSVLKGWPEYADGDTLCIHVIFPNLVAQQIANTLATRQIVTHGPQQFELVWTYFGYVDDTPEERAMRVKQINLIGPAGLISMEDGDVCELVQNAIVRDGDAASIVEMGGRDIADIDSTLTEVGMRGFWKGYRKIMGL